MKKLNVIFMGTPDFAVGAFRAIAEQHNIIATYTQPPRPKGRGQQVQKTPIHLVAEEMGIPVYTPKGFRKHPEEVEKFAALNADIAVVAAYGLILPKAILDAPAMGCVNIHASLLPRWRGADPIRRAILAGDEETGVTIMQMDEGLDTGDMLLVQPVEIEKEITGGELHDKLAKVGAQLIREYLEYYNETDAVAQPSEGDTYAEKIDKCELKIDWSKTAEEIHNQVRAFAPTPNAYFEYEDDRIKILKGYDLNQQARKDDETLEAPGTIIGCDKEGLDVVCGDGWIYRITEIKRSGKCACKIGDFLCGCPIGKSEVLG